MNNVRRRLINFRVTDEEFERLKKAANVKGSRCLSEFARLVMLGPSERSDAQSLEGKLSVFDRRLDVLESNVARLLDTLVSTEHKPHFQNQ